jgi:alpha-galactosidase
MLKFRMLAAASAAFFFPYTHALYPLNGLAKTPQMGWNNWNSFGCDVDEELLLSATEKLIQFGLRDAGYQYIVLDDCWSAGRSDNGTLQPNSTRFPNGMAEVANRIHREGFKFGMYSSAGTYTCARYAGSLNYEKQDAQTFADWGVDYLKYDNCYNEGQSGNPLITYDRYKKMSDALNSTGRQMLYSMCNWGEDYPWKWAQTVANSWRMSGDIYDSFNRPDARCPCTGNEEYNCALPGFHCSAMNILNKVSHYVDKGVPHAWNDLDALEVGNGGMTDDEYKTHFTMWAAVKSVLLMGNNMDKLSARALSILNNPAIIALSQDPKGSSAVRIWRHFVDDVDKYGQGEIQMWSGELSGGDYFVALINAGNSSRQMNATADDIFYDAGAEGTSEEAMMEWTLHDLWANRMPEEVAQALIDGNSTQASSLNVTSYYYNATETTYEDGLAKNDTLLLGTPVGTLAAKGSIAAEIPRHGIMAYRLRSTGRGLRKRDEL